MYNNYCKVTADLDRYLAELDNEERYDNYIQERMEEYLKDGGIYDPSHPDNFIEAMGEMPVSVLVKMNAAITASLGDETMHIIKEWVDKYWSDLAYERALDDAAHEDDPNENYGEY